MEWEELFSGSTEDLFVPDVLYGDEGTDDAQDGCIASSDEALIACINRCGAVDLQLMHTLSGIPVETLVGDLQGTAIFQDPEAFHGTEPWSIEKGWQLRARYLTGNIPKKLSVAQVMNQFYPHRFDVNIEVLQTMLPETIESDQIHVSLGARWVPSDVYATFISTLLKMRAAPHVYYHKDLCAWRIEYPPKAKIPDVENRYTYGTLDLSAMEIIEQTMNARTVRVYDAIRRLDGSTEHVINKAKTIEAQEKQNEIVRIFDEWIYADDARRELLQQCYNDMYVGFCASPYDGSFLRLPDLNPDVRLFRHQRDAIARVLLSGSNVLLAHDVGSGKTYEIVVSAHELYRMGMSRKNLIVVPNNVLRATADAHRYLYPQDRILTIYPKDFSPAYRLETQEQIRDEDFVCVYMAYSSFDRITMSKQYWIDKYRDKIRRLDEAIANSTTKKEKRELETERSRSQYKLETIQNDTEDTPYLPFEAMGIETLIVDEAHNYKNIPLQSRTTNIVGFHAHGSAKCREMVEKCRSVQRVVFATGTPLTNSLADLYVMQAYLQPEELDFRKIDSFDTWINTFCERETDYEVDVDADSLRVMTRFASFHNLTELMCLFSTVCDYHSQPRQDDAFPRFSGYRDVTVPRVEQQGSYLRYLAERTRDIRTGRIRREEDNLLKVTMDGRSCALDLRLIRFEEKKPEDEADGDGQMPPEKKWVLDPTQPTGNKTDACADAVAALYREYPGTCQIVFSDIGTPKPGFNIYDELRKALVERGVRESEIAYVHDATTETARKALFGAMNRGEVRVAIGSTMKLGIGVNVQEKLIALHHLSVPWRPADMVQREGRILRRGNLCPEIFIYRYVTAGSFDSYSWQLLQNKQRFIASFLSGASGTRDSEDIADTVLSYAEVKALAIGNPLIRLRVETANALERMRIRNRQRQKRMLELRAIADRMPEKLRSLRIKYQDAQADAALYASQKQTIPRDDRQAFGEELLDALRDNLMRATERVFDTYQGFDVILPALMRADEPYVLLATERRTRYSVPMDGSKPLGCAMRLDSVLEDLADRIARLQQNIEDTLQQQNAAEDDLRTGNPFAEQTDTLAKKLCEIDRLLTEEEEETV